MIRRAVPLLALVLPFAAEAAAPPLVPVTGYLTDATGAPLNDQVTMDLKLYRSSSATQTVWEEIQQVEVDNGQFTVYLGAQSPLDLATFKTNAALYLGMSVNNGAEMAPRFHVATAPYAGYAQYCDDAASVGGVLPTDLRRTTDPLAWGDLTGVPAGLADGDQDTLYTAGTGLALSSGDQFSADKTTIEGWARGVAYDSLTELRGDLDSVYMAKQACASQQILVSNGSGGWVCTDPTTLPVNETAVDNAVANNGYALGSALTALDGRVTTAETKVTSLQSDVTAIQSSVSAMQSQLGSAGNLVAQYEFDEASGTTFADTSGLGNDATTSSGGLTAGATGHSGLAISFLGAKGVAVATGNKVPDAAQISVDAWVRPEAGTLTGNKTIVEKNGAYSLRQIADKIAFTVVGEDSTCTATSPAPLVAGAWWHVRGTYDGIDLAVEVNGATMTVQCTSTAPDPVTLGAGRIKKTAGGILAIGGKFDGNAWTEGYRGYIDEVRIRPTATETHRAGALASIKSFSASGTWTRPAGVTSIEVIVTGGGGGGGSHNSDDAQGGGGAGGTAIRLLDVSAIPSVAVTIGAGGTGSCGNTPSGGTGGGTTSFGSYLSATGGSAPNNWGIGGIGGVGSGGDVNLVGNDGGTGNIDGAGNEEAGGSGGASYWGGGARGGSYWGARRDGVTGSGGGGTHVQSNNCGGNGGAGFVVVREYGY